MNFSVKTGNIVGVKTYTGYAKNTFSNNFINQEYELENNINTYNEVPSNSISFSDYDKDRARVEFFSDITNCEVIKSIYDTSTSLLKLLYFDVIAKKSNYKSMIGIGVSSGITLVWWILKAAGGKYEDVDKGFLNDFLIAGVGKSLSKEGLKFVGGKITQNVLEIGGKAYNEMIAVAKAGDSAFESLTAQYGAKVENILARNFATSFKDSKKGYLFYKNGPHGTFKDLTKNVGELSINKLGGALVGAAADIGVPVVIDFAVSVAVNAIKGWDCNLSFGQNMEALKLGSTLLKSTWKTILSKTGFFIGYSIAGPTGGKVGQALGTTLGSHIGDFLVDAFDGDEGWCAIAGVAGLAGGIAGGAIATALLTAGTISLAFPVGTVVGLAIIVGAAITTGIVYGVYLLNLSLIQI